jgi:hypothetical protein
LESFDFAAPFILDLFDLLQSLSFFFVFFKFFLFQLFEFSVENKRWGDGFVDVTGFEPFVQNVVFLEFFPFFGFVVFDNFDDFDSLLFFVLVLLFLFDSPYDVGIILPHDGDKEVNFDSFISFGNDEAAFGVVAARPLFELFDKDVKGLIKTEEFLELLFSHFIFEAQCTVVEFHALFALFMPYDALL